MIWYKKVLICELNMHIVSNKFTHVVGITEALEKAFSSMRANNKELQPRMQKVSVVKQSSCSSEPIKLRDRTVH